jgi:hypothetical protein
MQPWRQSLTEHYAQPAYNGTITPPEQMLDEVLATAEHALQHGTHCVAFESIDGIYGLKVSLALPLFLPLADLASYGYIPTKGQSAENFVQTHWNWY